MIEALVVGQLYSNEEIFRALRVSNAGGIRLSLQDGAVLRAIIMTSGQGYHGAGENPYHDRLEGGILTYTATGKVGQQTLAGVNSRLIEQKIFNFPIHGFVLTASRRDRSVGPKRWVIIYLPKSYDGNGVTGRLPINDSTFLPGRSPSPWSLSIP